MTGKFAAKTEVPAERSRAEIEATLSRYGADQFLFGWEDARALIAFRHSGRQIRFLLEMPAREDRAFTTYQRGSSTFRRAPAEAQKLWEQATRQKWRALALVIKAKLEAVAAGISVFEDEFLANIVLPTGQLAGEWMRPQIARAYSTGQMPPLLPGPSGSE